MIDTLREQATKLLHEARSILDALPEDATPEAVAEANRRADELLDQHAALEQRIKAEEARVAIAETLERYQEEAEREAREARRPIDDGAFEPRSAGAAPDLEAEYRQAFAAALRAGGNTAQLDPEQRAVIQRYHAERRALSSGTGAAGGFLVPTTLLNQLIEVMAASGPMFGDLPRVLQTTSGEPIQIPTVDATDLTGSAKAEGATIPDTGASDPTFGQKTLGAYVYTSDWINVPMELMSDSIVNLEAFLGEMLGELLGRTANSVLTNGTGTGEPEGIVTGAQVGATAAAAAAITADDLLALEHSVDPIYRNPANCRWMVHDDVARALRTLKDSTGRYLWNEDLTTGRPATLFGYPVVVNQAMPNTIATGVKTVLFGDVKSYWVRKVNSPAVLVDSSSKAVAPNSAMAGLIRFDGAVIRPQAIKVLQQA